MGEITLNPAQSEGCAGSRREITLDPTSVQLCSVALEEITLDSARGVQRADPVGGDNSQPLC